MKIQKIYNTGLVYIKKDLRHCIEGYEVEVHGVPGNVLIKEAGKTSCVFCGSEDYLFTHRHAALCKECLLEMHEGIYNTETDAMMQRLEEVEHGKNTATTR